MKKIGKPISSKGTWGRSDKINFFFTSHILSIYMESVESGTWNQERA
jgi:hypothetical protein